MSNGNMPAAPTPYMEQTSEGGELYCDQQGLTKREHFAGLAMQAVLNQFNPFEQGDFDSSDYDTVVKNSVGLADALLKELENTNKE